MYVQRITDHRSQITDIQIIKDQRMKKDEEGWSLSYPVDILLLYVYSLVFDTPILR